MSVSLAVMDQMFGLGLRRDLATSQIVTMRLRALDGTLAARPEDHDALAYCLELLEAGSDGLLFVVTDGARGRQQKRAFLDRIQDFGKSEGMLPDRVVEAMRDTVDTLQSGGRVLEDEFLLIIRFLNFLTYGKDQPHHIKTVGLPASEEAE